MGEYSDLDLEFNRHLQLLRPYLAHLVNHNVTKFCEEWIQKLSSYGDNVDEKRLRNRYLFMLCYQLYKGVLEPPFLEPPPKSKLGPCIELTDRDSTSTDAEFIHDTSNETKTQILFDNKVEDFDVGTQSKEHCNAQESMNHFLTLPKKALLSDEKKDTLFCGDFDRTRSGCFNGANNNVTDTSMDKYEYRTYNIIMRLRDLKKQNLLLQDELMALKSISREKLSCIGSEKNNDITSESDSKKRDVVISIENKFSKIDDITKKLLSTIESLQTQVKNLEESKKVEIEELKARHRMEIAQLDNSSVIEGNIKALKERYEVMLIEIKNTEISCKEGKDAILERDKLKQDIIEKNKQIAAKDFEINEMEKELQEKDNLIRAKLSEIANYENLLKTERAHFKNSATKLLDKSNGDKNENEDYKIKAQSLEKRLIRMEKSKAKCLKLYEDKLASMQREKYLTECSLNLQLLRQRTQVINESVDEHQSELNVSLDKLEAKYKEVVANIHAQARERRVQDDKTINSLLKAAQGCSLLNEGMCNQDRVSAKNITSTKRKSESTAGISGNTSTNNHRGSSNDLCNEDDNNFGYFLNGEKLTELLEHVQSNL